MLRLLFAAWRSVPPSSIVTFVTLNGVAFVQRRMSKVPPAWMVTGTAALSEIAISGISVEAVESITTVPPNISTPEFILCWVWLFLMLSVPAPYFKSFEYVLLLSIGGWIVTSVVSLETVTVFAT